MKKLKSTLFTLCTCIGLFAQAPQSINYQAIAWNANNTPRTNQTITVTFNIRSTTAEGTIEFTETHTTTTNEQGLFTSAIGTANQNGFKTIDWSKSPKFLQVIVDGLPAGTTQILSVPYALYAERTKLAAGAGIGISGNTISNTGDRDTTNELQTLSRNGNILTLSKGGGTVDLPTTGGGGTTYSGGTGISISPTNVISTDLKAGEGIIITGNMISAINPGSGGTGTTYTAGKGINISGNTISNTGDGDTSTVNEIQSLSFNSNNNQLTLSRGGGTVTLPNSGGGTGTTYTAGTGIAINNNVISNTGDTDSKNEIQTLSINGSQLSLSQGGMVTLPSSAYTAGTGIAIDGSNKISTSNGVPAGSIMAYGGVTPPTGWLACDGDTVSRANYPELHDAIGTHWGSGDKSAGSFSLPDLRGLFLRGVDAAANNDPDKLSRTPRNGSNAGNQVGSYQEDQFQGHFHTSDGARFLNTQPGGEGASTTGKAVFISPGIKEPIADGTNGQPRFGAETRPKNVYVLYIIKY